MIIQATEKELSQGVLLGNQFSKESKFVRFNADIVIENVKNLIKNNIGVLFFAYADFELIGMICGIKYPDFLTRSLTAMELFWFVDKRKRGVGLKLLIKFESWARKENCKSIIMMHLSDSMPEEVKTIYEKKGYQYLESHYIKEL